MKGTETQIVSITTTQLTFNIKGSYLNTPINPTYVKLKILIYPSEQLQFYSETYLQSIPGTGLYVRSIGKGTYDETKYGNYLVYTFVSGIYFGQSTTYTTIRPTYQIVVNAPKTQITISANNLVTQMQVTYLIAPNSLPYVFQNPLLFKPSTFYQDDELQYYEKYQNFALTINNPPTTNHFAYQSFYGINGLDMDFLLNTYYDYQLLPRFQNNVQIGKFSFDSYYAYKVYMNGLYLEETYAATDPLCFSRLYYSQACTNCVNNRIYSTTAKTCVCPDSKFTPYPDEVRCSYGSQAVLNVVLSITFDQLVIDFGLKIIINGFTNATQPSNELCKHVFLAATYNLIQDMAKCSVSGKQLIVTLESDATIMKGDIVQFNNFIRFQGQSIPITSYFRNTVQQAAITYTADAEILYDEIIDPCLTTYIQIKRFINQNKRGATWAWTIVSITPADLTVQTNLQIILDKSNNDKSRNILIPRTTITENTTVELKLSYIYNIGISGESVIQFQSLIQPKLELKSYLTQPQPYYRKDEFEIFYEINYYACNSKGQIFQLNPATFDIQIDEINIPFSETISSFTSRAYSIRISSYLLKSSQTYDIMTSITVKENPSISLLKSHQLITQPTPLLVFIDGGNILHDYNQQLTIKSFIKDLDIEIEADQLNGITIQWECLQIETLTPCLDIENSVIIVPQGQTSITFSEYTFIPFTSVQFVLTGSKDTRIQRSQVVVQFTDSQIPPLSISLKDGVMLKSTVNMNEIIEALIVYDPTEDVNNLFFAGAIIYERKIQKTIRFDYGQVRFQLWNYFSQFKITNNKFQIKFTVYNPKYTMPSQSVLTFFLNFPPQNCQLTVEPASGFSLQTLFTISLSQCEDIDDPITYKFFVYTDSTKLQYEIENPLQIQRQQLTDQIFESTIQTYLPPGNLLLLAQAIDNKNAIFNITQTIQVGQSTFDESSYITNVNSLIQFASNQAKPLQTQTLSLLVEDIISRPAYWTALQTQTNQIVNDLKLLSDTEYTGSTFCNLAAQSISSIVKYNLQNMNLNHVSEHIDYAKYILDIAQTQLPIGTQFEIDKQNQQLYNSFKLLNGVAQIAKQVETSSIGYIEQTERLGRLLNVDALPNESSKVFKEDNLLVASQVITSKYIPFYLNQENANSNWENQSSTPSNEPLNQLYDVSFISYTQNPYQVQKPFQDFISQIQEQKPEFKMIEYKAINPMLALHENEIDITLNNQIRHSFKQQKDEPLTCINEVKQKWTAQGCKSVYSELNKVYHCICDTLSPVTVVNDIADLFDDNQNFQTIFSDDGISNILDFDQFYKYIAFWCLVTITLTYIGLSVYGIILDKIILSKRSIPFSPLISSNQVFPLNSTPPDIKPLETKEDVVLQNLDNNNKLNIPHLEAKQQTISARSLAGIGDGERQRLTTKIQFQNIVQKALKNKLEYLPTKQFSKTTLPQASRYDTNTKIISDESEKQVMNQNSSDYESERKETSDHQLHTNNSENNGYAKLKSKSLFHSILLFHDFFSIITIYDPTVSRLTRLTVFYIKNLHIFTSNIVFNQSYSITQAAFLQFCNLVVVAILSKFIELGLNLRNVMKRIIQVLIFGLVCFYYYAFLSVASGKPPSSTNTISLIYFAVLSADIFVLGMILSVGLRQIALSMLSSAKLSSFKQKLWNLIKLPIILQNIDA